MQRKNTPPKMKVLSTYLIFVSFASTQLTSGLQLSMVASRAPFRRTHSHSRGPKVDNSFRLTSLTGNSGTSSNVTSTLISQLACMALKRRLEDHTHVSCDLTADSNNLLLGRVGPVTVKGRGWQSPLGLTCKAMEATVNECKLDIGRVISNQKLVLTTPAEGQAMVALSATDFGNFITHPLMKPPSPPMNSRTSSNGINSVTKDSRLVFSRENVSMNPSIGTVTFYGNYAGSNWRFILQRALNSEHKAKIVASLADPQQTCEKMNINYEYMEKALALSTSQFFNEMVFELDGTFLSFEDMMLTDKGKEASVMLSLRIIVEKFPSPGIQF